MKSIMPNSLLKTLWFFYLIICIISCSAKEDPKRKIKTISTQEQLIAANRVLIKKDKKRIEGHIQRMAWIMQESETGLWYEILKEGEGALIEDTDRISLSFTLSLLDGTPCYSSDKSGLKTFVVGKGGVESGLEQAVLLCKTGTQARFILPPHLAWGLPGDGDKIPARSTIIYEIEIHEIEKK